MAYVPGAPQQFEAALAFYNDLISQHPNVAELYYDLAELLYHRNSREHFRLIKDFFFRALSLKPNWKETYPEWTWALRMVGELTIAYEDNLEEGKAILRRMLESEEEIASLHPLGKQGVRVLSTYNVPQHLGHVCFELDLFVKMRQLQWRADITPIMLAGGAIANPRLLDYWARHFDIVYNPDVVRDLSHIQRWLRYETYYVRLLDGDAYPAVEAMPIVQNEWEARAYAPVLSLFPEDYERGWQVLKSWGVPSNAWFVGIHARERGYYNDPPRSPTSLYRNVDIETYSSAIKAIVEAGGWVIRMGDPTMKPLPPLPNTIDYARSSDRSDWMDIFLSSQCRFFLGSQSGLMNLPSIFGKPCAVTNWVKLCTLPCFPADTFIMKHIWSHELKRYLTLDEFVLPPYSTASDDRLYEGGIEMHDNTPEDIRDLALDMLERTSATLPQYSKEDLELQSKVKKILSSPFSTQSKCSMSPAYLRKYQQLLFSQ
jgi:putative glycosyltransferase (TIGR04372 family)